MAEVTSEIYVWEGTLTDGSIPPYEGDNVLSWQTAGLGWFGAGIMSIQPLNLFDFGDGHLKFRIKIPAHVTFKIGIIDAWNNQYYVSFPAYQTTYGLVRDGEWGQASIPVSDIRGTGHRSAHAELRVRHPRGERHGLRVRPGRHLLGRRRGHRRSRTTTPPAGGSTCCANAPNPFNAMTEIRFDLPAGGTYDLVVYDVAGRRVKSFDGIGSVGRNAVAWDGRDASGAYVASGVYHYRLTTEDGTATSRMVLVK